MKLILDKKINKLKELWKTLKPMGLPSNVVTASNICLKDKNEIAFSVTKNCSIFKNCFLNLPYNLVSKLPLSPNIVTESKTASYYDNNVVSKNLNFEPSETSPEKVLSILKDLNPSKTAGINNLSGKFLKDAAYVLARPISQLYSLSIKLNSFSTSYKIAKVKPLLKKDSKTDPQNTALFYFSHCYQKLLKQLFMIKLKSF